jgi:hypothetical protein
MPGHEDRQAFRFPERTEPLRWETPLKYCCLLAVASARRIAESKNSFPWSFFRGDCHSHTQHSDGVGTVAETAEMVKAADLDFQFVTDHWGVTQAPECREHGLWYGQEPVTQFHHMGILGLEYAFEPQQDFLADLAAVAEQGATVFVPHPTGWWPSMVYNEEQKQILEELPSPFLMEICNGANNIVSAFDYTDDSALELWDHLLCLGRKVHAMGNTDAHAPHGIGIIWNGVFAAQCDQHTILAELKKGHSFVSEAALLHIALGQARMGDTASQADRESELEVAVVDSRGLNSVAIIADGEEIFYQHLRNETVWNGKLSLPANAQHYVRVEARSYDGKRGYSNPIYLS